MKDLTSKRVQYTGKGNANGKGPKNNALFRLWRARILFLSLVVAALRVRHLGLLFTISLETQNERSLEKSKHMTYSGVPICSYFHNSILWCNSYLPFEFIMSIIRKRTFETVKPQFAIDPWKFWSFEFAKTYFKVDPPWLVDLLPRNS